MTLARLTTCLMSLIALSLGSCSAPPAPLASPSSSMINPSSTPSTPIATQPSPSRAVDRLTTPTGASAQTMTINIYKIDSQCANLAPEKVTVAATQSLEAAIAKVLAETDSGDFSIAGYRVSRDGTRAIVDFRLPANSRRSFHSLSSCEQLALFGGIRKTLINNSQWNVRSVQFTEKGQEIVL